MSETCHQRIGRYEVLAELGHGAMGIVYKAHDPQLDRTVAIKALRPDLGLPADQYTELRKRSYQEAMTAGRLNHPNIVAIYDVLQLDETPYIIMEYVDGRTLAHVIRGEGPLHPAQAVPMVLQVCRALEYAHARQVVHRDIKPANLLVAGGREVKVSDFGIARIAGKKLTQTGVMLGSPAYMSPEQVQGHEVDGRSDLFSLGVVLYEALTGADAFPGEDPSTILYHIVHGEPVPLPERNPGVSPALDAVVRRVLAKDPDERYPTGRSFADALSEALEKKQPDAAGWRQRTVVLGSGSAATRRRMALIGAGCFLTLIVGGAMFWSRPIAKEGPASAGTPGTAIREAPPSASRGSEGTAAPGAALPAQAAGVAPHGEGALSGGAKAQPSAGKASRRKGEDAEPASGSQDAGRAMDPWRPLAGSLPAAPSSGGANVAGVVPPRAASRSAAWGCLSVNAIPFARVYVDGQYAGETPRGCLRVPAGDRRVHFEANGQRSPARILHVTEQHTAGNPQSISYDFAAGRFLDQ